MAGYRSYSYDQYKMAIDMYKDGFKLSEISRRLGVKKRTVEDWIYEGKKPWLARWHPEPSVRLAYVIGVLLGDGCLVKPRRNIYEVELKVRDYEFAKEFSRAMSILLGKKYKEPEWSKVSNRWRVYYRSKAFYTWYKQQTLETLKKYIEYDKETVANFLKGIYDSDGCNYKCKRIHLYNNNLTLLYYVQYLLKKYFNIISTGPYINVRAGTICITKERDIIKTNRNNYRIDISRKRDLQSFLNNIGFSILKKQYGIA